MRSRTTRLLAVAFSVGSLIAVSAALPAGATAIVKGATCSKAVLSPTNTKTSTAKSALSACTNLPATGGSGTLVASFKKLPTVSVTITWKGTGTSTFTLKEAVGKPNKCKTSGKTQDSLIVSTGTVTGGTGKAPTYLKGTKFSESLCIHAGGTTKAPVDTEYLEPGSKITI